MDEKKIVTHTPIDPDVLFAELEEKIRSSGSDMNIERIRDAYIMEAKVAYLQDHLYGSDGSLLSEAVREEERRRAEVLAYTPEAQEDEPLPLPEEEPEANEPLPLPEEDDELSSKFGTVTEPWPSQAISDTHKRAARKHNKSFFI